MSRRNFLAACITGLLLAGCGNNSERPDGYVTQPSMALTKYNLSHSRLTLSSANSGILTFSADAFTYESGSTSLTGTWDMSEYPAIVNVNEERYFVSSINYTTSEGYSFTTTFASGTYELIQGDRFVLSGDQLLSATVTRIEVAVD